MVGAADADALKATKDVPVGRKGGGSARFASRALLVLALCASGSAAADTVNWASSADTFLERWNGHVTEIYHVSGFHRDSVGKLTGDLPGASIYALGSMYSLSTRDLQMFEAMCTHTVQAALGVSLEEAHPLVAAALSQARSAEIGDYGMVVYEGYRVSVATAAAGQEFVCTVRQVEHE